VTSAPPKLLIATNNAGKVDEFRELLRDSGWEVISPAAAGIVLEPEETGSTYHENALLKAKAFADAAGFAALADDSGLEVDALGGEPGALHHLRGWDGVDQADRIAILLGAMKDVPSPRRTARFRAVIVVVLPGGAVIEEQGVSEGMIAEKAAGSEGFGYDPVFIPAGHDQTMAQLGLEEKNRISHRAIAAAKIRERLKQVPSEEPGF